MLHAKEAALLTSSPVMQDSKQLLRDCERAINQSIKQQSSVLGVTGVMTIKAAIMDVSMWKDSAVMEAIQVLQEKHGYKCAVRATDTTPSCLVISWEHIK